MKRIFFGGDSMSGLLTGKNIVVMGVANQRSIAWGNVKSWHRECAYFIVTNRPGGSSQKLQELLQSENIEAKLQVTCDVASDESIKTAFQEIKQEVCVIHGLVHSVAFANTDELK